MSLDRAASSPLEFAPASNIRLSERTLQRICSLIYKLAGISIDSSKQQLIRSRLTKRLNITGETTFEAYLDKHIEPHAQAGHKPKTAGGKKDEVTEFIDALCTNLTSFFRENQHFNLIRDHLMPHLFKVRGETRRIRLWNAGCSTGEEPYTLAMTVRAALESHQASIPPASRGPWDIQILATDISTKVLQVAANGVYPASRCTGIPPAMQGKYIAPRRMPDGTEALAIAPQVRQMVKFRHLNLNEPWPFNGKFDAIMCRNVMIYFDKPTQTRLVSRFHEHLERGGLFFTGHSESLTGIRHPFTARQAAVYERTR